MNHRTNPPEHAWFLMGGISKHFGGVMALEDVDFEVNRGEVHGLVGENGAGKSTLINIATGTIAADSGRLLLDDRPIQVHHPRQALDHGIAVVHQEADLFSDLSVAENMLLGQGLPTGPVGWYRGARPTARPSLLWLC